MLDLVKQSMGTDERLLGEILGQVRVSGQAICQAIDPIHMGVVETPLGRRISGEDRGYQLPVVLRRHRLRWCCHSTPIDTGV